MYFRTSSKIIWSCTIEEDINYVRGCKFLYLNLRKQNWLKNPLSHIIKQLVHGISW